MIKRLLGVLLFTGITQAMVFDNRYLPLLLKPFERRDDTANHLRIQPFFMHADKAFSDGGFDIDIPNIFRTYDQGVLDQSLFQVGCGRFLRSDFSSGGTICWNRFGRIDAQGLAFLYERALTPWLSVGINGLFAHVASRHEFFLAERNVSEGTQAYLSGVKQEMHEALGLCPPLFSETGFGDLDVYLRFGYCWDYICKVRSIDAGLRFGVIAPSAKERDVFNPASIAIGGNKHWGVYAQLEGDVELKEDLSVGLWFRASKRITKTRCLRFPLCQGQGIVSEPPEYGVLTGPVKVKPGWTFVFNPQVELSHLRRGLGLKAFYTLIAHLEDKLTDVRADRSCPSDLVCMQNASSWGSEYVTIGAYYDFGSVRGCVYPKASLYWDIPVDWLVAKRAARTHSVSLMLECDF